MVTASQISTPYSTIARPFQDFVLEKPKRHIYDIFRSIHSL